MNNGIRFDYAYFLQKMIQLDTDEDCALSQQQYTILLQDLNITYKKDFDKVSFRAMRARKTHLITFENIKTIIDALLFAPMSKAMLLIIYRGIADRRKDRDFVNFEQYNLIAYYILNEYSLEDIQNKFEQCKQYDSNKISYEQVVRSLLHKKTHKDENPFNEKIEIISKHSHNCRI